MQARNRAINRFGNLTIVTQPLNSGMKNASFSTKKDHLRKSLLLLNRYFDDVEDWDEAAIEVRSKELFGTAKRVWTKR
jgi:hypothetical protein